MKSWNSVEPKGERKEIKGIGRRWHSCPKRYWGCMMSCTTWGLKDNPMTMKDWSSRISNWRRSAVRRRDMRTLRMWLGECLGIEFLTMKRWRQWDPNRSSWSRNTRKSILWTARLKISSCLWVRFACWMWNWGRRKVRNCQVVYRKWRPKYRSCSRSLFRNDCQFANNSSYSCWWYLVSYLCSKMEIMIFWLL